MSSVKVSILHYNSVGISLNIEKRAKKENLRNGNL